MGYWWIFYNFVFFKKRNIIPLRVEKRNYLALIEKKYIKCKYVIKCNNSNMFLLFNKAIMNCLQDFYIDILSFGAFSIVHCCKPIGLCMFSSKYTHISPLYQCGLDGILPIQPRCE